MNKTVMQPGLPGRRRRPLVGSVLTTLVLTFLFAGLAFTDPFFVRTARDLVFDGYQRLSPRPYDPQVPVTVVAIDDRSLAELGQWPWPRATLADLVGRLTQAGAAVVALDVLFAEPERQGHGMEPGAGDAALRQALADGRTVIGQALVEMGSAPVVRPGFAHAGDDPRLFAPHYAGAITPLPALAEAAYGVGALNWIPDRDLVVRRVPTLFTVGNSMVPTFAIEALRVAQQASSLVVRASNASGETAFGAQSGISALRIGQVTAMTDRDGSLRVRYAGTQPQRRLSAIDVIAARVAPERLEGHVVLIGATAAALSDIRATPLEGAVPGIDVHAEIIEHLLSGASLSRPDYAPALEALLIVTGAAIAALAAVKLSPMLGAAVALIMVELMIGGSFWAFLRRDILIDAALPGLATIGAYAVMTVGVLRRSQRDQRAIRASFGRYLSPAIVDKIAANPEQLALGGEIRTITVLFSDIRGFTQRSETLAAQDVLGFLNAIHTPMTEEVLNSGGTLDKFIGDGMMAFWNAPLDVPDHTRRALACALRMEKAMERVEVDLRAESDRRGVSHSPVAIGIGIHVGPACVGNVGSVKRLEYSAIGDNVNTAARIEPTSKLYGITTIVSQDVVEAAGDFALLPIDDTQLRGRSGTTRLFALHGGPDMRDPNFEKLVVIHEAVLAALASGDVTGAAAGIAMARANPLGPGYARVHALWETRLAQNRGDAPNLGSLPTA